MFIVGDLGQSANKGKRKRRSKPKNKISCCRNCEFKSKCDVKCADTLDMSGLCYNKCTEEECKNKARLQKELGGQNLFEDN